MKLEHNPGLLTEEELSHEKDIIWLGNPLNYPFLREITRTVASPNQSISPKTFRGKLIGYAMFDNYFDNSGLFKRRCWYIKETDFFQEKSPWESVISSSIKAGKYSLMFSANTKDNKKHNLHIV